MHGIPSALSVSLFKLSVFFPSICIHTICLAEELRIQNIGFLAVKLKRMLMNVMILQGFIFFVFCLPTKVISKDNVIFQNITKISSFTTPFEYIGMTCLW